MSDNEETILYQDANCTNILKEAIGVNHLSSELDLAIEGNVIATKRTLEKQTETCGFGNAGKLKPSLMKASK